MSKIIEIQQIAYDMLVKQKDDNYKIAETASFALINAEKKLRCRAKQIAIAVDCLNKYRTLVVEDTKYKDAQPMRLGKHAEDALNLMKALNDKLNCGE